MGRLTVPIHTQEPITRLVWVEMFLAVWGACWWGSAIHAAILAGSLMPPFNDFIRGDAFIGHILALIGAVMAAGYVIIGRRLRSKVSLVGYITLVYGMAAIVLIAIMLAAGQPAFGYPKAAYVWLILLALIPQLLGHTSFNWALKYLSAAYVAITLLGEPIGSTLLAYFLLEETPSALKIFGAILILFGIYIASQSEIRNKR